MGFGKIFNKSKTDSAPVAEPLKPLVTLEEPKVKANVTMSTNNVLSDTRDVLDKIIDKLKRMKTDTKLEQEFKEVTAVNSRGMEQRKKDTEAFVIKMLDIEEKMFLTENDRQTYWSYIDEYIRIFEDKSGAETLDTGAYRLIKHALIYLNSFEDALRTGKKHKANMCNKMLVYIIKSGYHREDIPDPDELEIRMKLKEKIVKEQGMNLLGFIDTLYNLINQHGEMYSEWVDKSNQYYDLRLKLGEIPADVQKKIDSMGFTEAVEKLPVNSDERRIYLPVLLRLANLDLTVRELSTKMDAIHQDIVQRKSEIERVFAVMKEQMSINGRVMNYEEYSKKMNEFYVKFNSDIANMQKNVEENKKREAQHRSAIRAFERTADLVASGATDLQIIIQNDNKIQNMERSIKQIKENSEKMRKQFEKELEDNPIEENLDEPATHGLQELQNE